MPQVAKTQPGLLATQAKGWTHSYDDGWQQGLQASGPRWALGVLLSLWGAADCGPCEAEGKGSGETHIGTGLPDLDRDLLPAATILSQCR